MAIDTEAQQLTIYKEVFLAGVKNIIITGDSIASRFCDHAGYEFSAALNSLLENKAIPGSNISKVTINDPETWNPQSFAGRSEQGASLPIDVRNADLLIVWGGFNDVGDDVPLGDLDSTDPYTTAGAIRTGVQNYMAKNPDLKIMFITPNANPYKTANSLGLNINDYRIHIFAICEYMNIPCFDLYDQSGITEINKASALPDEIHPTAEFLRMWQPLITDFIDNNIAL